METTQDRSEIKNAAAGFYKALNALFTGNASHMTEVWSHANDVTYLGPQGGVVIGWENISNTWNEQAQLKLGGTIEPHDMHVIVDGTMGITHNYEVGTNYVNGKPQTVKIRASNVFRKENGKWKMIGHQTDLLPYLSNRAG